jgi:phosphoheptose isomerase
MLKMEIGMDDQISRKAPRALTDVLDASVRDIATGSVGDAADAQRQARRMLAHFEKSQPGASATTGRSASTRARRA